MNEICSSHIFCVLVSMFLGGLVYGMIHERYQIKNWLCKQRDLANKKIKERSYTKKKKE